MLTVHKESLKNLRYLIIISIALSIIGGIFIYSSSSVYALEKQSNALYFVYRQLIGMVLGIVLVVIIQFVPSSVLQRSTPLLMLSSLIVTLMTFIPGLTRHIHGASRWVSIGGLTFQPSELLKITLVMYVAHILSKKDWSQARLLFDYLPFSIIIGIPCLAILAQPDFGLTVTLVTTIFFMLFFASLRLQHLLTIIGIGAPIALALIILKSYRLQRILIFLNPWKDPLGSGFQIIQSLIAIGSGSYAGLGIGNSRQKFFYLPMQHTDFIFSVIAEETGFLGASILIFLYLGILLTGLRMALTIKNKFASLLIAGFCTMISLQALINIAVATGLVPTKGIGLPFVSYGNTSLVCSMVMIGIIINLVNEYA